MKNLRPEFAIVAGPNGAGKSLLSPFYIHSKCFDGDLLALKLRKEHPEWEERWYSGTVASELERQKNNALAGKQNFAFETNFSNDMPLNLISQFRAEGYKICLYYFGLDSIVNCKERVQQRVALGGHDVADELIEFNYNEGIRRIQDALPLFDNITFIDGFSPYGKIVALYIKASGIHEVSSHNSEWFNTLFAPAFNSLKDK